MKKHNLFKVVGIVILAYVILTWFVNASYFQGTLQGGVKAEVGLGYLINIPVQTLGYFSYIFVFILAVGAFYELLNATGVYKKALDTIVKPLKKHKQITLIVTIVLIALLSSFTGLELGMLFIFPFVISVIIMLGYDKITALLATLGGVVVGMIGSTYSYNSYGIINNILGVSYNNAILLKVILLVLSLALLIVFMLLRLKSLKKAKDLNKEAMELLTVEDKQRKNTCQKVWPIITMICLAFVILLLGVTNLKDAFNITWFDDALTAITRVKIGDYALFDKLLGGITAFGTWSGPTKFVYFTGTLIIVSIIIAIIYKISFNDYVDSICKGAKGNLKAAALTVCAYMVLVIASSFPIFLTITKAITAEKFNVATTGISALLGSLLYVDIYYYPQYVLQYFASFKDVDANILSVLFVSIYSLALIAMPTSVLLLTTLQKTNTTYPEWIKQIWKLFVGLLILIFVVLAIFYVI